MDCNHKGIGWDRRDKGATLMAAEGSRNRHTPQVRRTPAKNEHSAKESHGKQPTLDKRKPTMARTRTDDELTLL
jgi:hypothetical protein